MKTISAEPYPHADSLRLYKIEAPERTKISIITNLESIYHVGDIVAIALVDSILRDGTKIKPIKLRGIYSYGMVLDKNE